MNFYGRIIAYSILCGSMCASLGGCSRKEPSTAEIEASIAQTISGYDIKDVKCEAFSDKNQEAAGRASCRGTLAINQDLYTLLPTIDLENLLVAAGIPQEGSRFFLGRHARAIFVPAVTKGSETSFAADCTYLGDVNGWRIGCSPNFEQFVGQPLDALGDNFALKDSPEYSLFVNEVMSDYRQLDAAFMKTKSDVDKFFSRGRTVSNVDGTVRAVMVSPLIWTGDRSFLGQQPHFSMETKYEDRRDNTTMTFCGYTKGVPKEYILFSGDIGFVRDRESGQEIFPANVQMMGVPGTLY